ncbi:MAG: M23 family metallopeptidase [Bdellovibrionales bacterium]|nr:M23 family metallopeptidase [Bdellovibrionales bacterium]
MRYLPTLLFGIVFLATGCASVMKTLQVTQDPTLNQIVDSVPLSPETKAKLEMYRKYSAKFMKYHDSGNLDDGDILDVLRDTGVIEGGPSSAPGRPAPKRVPPPVSAYKGKYRWPTAAGVVSSEYGARWGKMHKGIDVAAETGEPILAAADGVVLYSDNKMSGYGNVVILRHDDRHTTFYAHNTRNLVAVGQKVKSQQKIALLGSTGKSTGPHTHFEIRDGGTPLDPRKKLGPAPYAIVEVPEPPPSRVAREADPAAKTFFKRSPGKKGSKPATSS